MTRLLIVSSAILASGVLVAAQAPATARARVSLPMLAAAPEMSCKVISDTEVEVQFRDQSTRRVMIPSETRAATTTMVRPMASVAGRGRASTGIISAMGGVGATGGIGVTRGFDDNGDPYVDQRMPDGTVRRTQENGITVIHPDGSTQFIPFSSTRSHAQAPTPPDLPADPMRGRAWMEQHSEALLDMIKSLTRDDVSEMAKFAKGERATAGNDLFAQLTYRTKVAGFLAGQH